MKLEASRFIVKIADTTAEVEAAQRLRYRVFVEEMGATVSDEDRAAKMERDAFDPYFDHLILIDTEIEDSENSVVGVYRLMRGSVARQGIGFYGASEYDMSKLIALKRETVELGRSCVAAAHRGGSAMHLLWNGLSEYVQSRDIEVMFGVASFHGRDPDLLAAPLSYLYHNHLAPEDIRVRTVDPHYVNMNRLAADALDRKEVMRSIPPLIKAYLRLGGFVGDGAFVDHDFNTVDVCLLMDTTRMTERYHSYYTRSHEARK